MRMATSIGKQDLRDCHTICILGIRISLELFLHRFRYFFARAAGGTSNIHCKVMIQLVTKSVILNVTTPSYLQRQDGEGKNYINNQSQSVTPPLVRMIVSVLLDET